MIYCNVRFISVLLLFISVITLEICWVSCSLNAKSTTQNYSKVEIKYMGVSLNAE